MPGYSDYASKNEQNYITGQIPQPALTAVYLALFTTAPSADSGSGAVEVSGSGYARVQVAGQLATNAATSTSSPTLSFVSLPAWLTGLVNGAAAGVGGTVYDITTGKAVGTIASLGATTITLAANAANAVGNGDTLAISLFSNATGSSPTSVTNGGTIGFATPSANWGTISAFGLYDAATSGDLLAWDYLGNYAWQPCFITSASPGVFDIHAHGFGNGDQIVYYTEYGGTAPTGITAGNTLQTVAGSATDSFNIGVNTSSTGNGMARKVASQVVSANVVVYYAPGALVLTST